MFSVSWQELDSKIDSLESDVNSASNWLNSYNRDEWLKIMSLCIEINENFKGVRYPTKNERSVAWQRFFNLRHKAYEERNRIQKTTSKERKSEIYGMLYAVDYDWLADFIVGQVLSFGLMATRAEEMKWAGQKLKEAGQYFSSVKHEMTREDKAEIFNRIVDIRNNHDLFWSRYKEISRQQYEKRREEKQRAWEEKQRAWEQKQEKSRMIRNRIENNLEKNRERLAKALNALERCRENRRNLQSKIYDSDSDEWRSKAEGWLDELDDKIEDIESSVERLRDWISEDRDKLNNWS